MFSTIEFPKGTKARIWIDELPDSRIDASYVIENKVATYCKEGWNVNKIALELYLPKRHHSNYGLLGIETLSTREQNTLFANIRSNNSNSKLYENTMGYGGKTVYCGLLDEYAETINRKILDFALRNSNLPSGTIDFIAGAHCEIGSSKAVFGMITEILLSLLYLNKKEYSDMEIQKHIDNLLIFP